MWHRLRLVPPAYWVVALRQDARRASGAPRRSRRARAAGRRHTARHWRCGPRRLCARRARYATAHAAPRRRAWRRRQHGHTTLASPRALAARGGWRIALTAVCAAVTTRERRQGAGRRTRGPYGWQRDEFGGGAKHTIVGRGRKVLYTAVSACYAPLYCAVVLALAVRQTCELEASKNAITSVHRAQVPQHASQVGALK